ncbi:MAG: hypothetical protein ACI923_001498 [Flavobacteriales bacterium]|jgi:hypothetical protein
MGFMKYVFIAILMLIFRGISVMVVVLDNSDDEPVIVATVHF